MFRKLLVAGVLSAAALTAGVVVGPDPAPVEAASIKRCAYYDLGEGWVAWRVQLFYFGTWRSVEGGSAPAYYIAWRECGQAILKW